MKSKGTIYLLHFEQPYKHARHYLGIAENVEARIAEHRAGRGARLMEVIASAGITFVVARTWENATRTQERSKKGRGLAALCPICRAARAAALANALVAPAHPSLSGEQIKERRACYVL